MFLAVFFVLALSLLAFMAYREAYGKKGVSEILEETRENSRGVRYYAYREEVETNTQGFEGNARINVTSKIYGGGNVDLRGRFMHASIRMNVKGVYSERDVLVGEDVEIYATNDTMYSSSGGGWIKQGLEAGSWDTTGPLRLNALMENSDTMLGGTDSLDGKKVYVISIEPLKEAADASLTGYWAGPIGKENNGISTVPSEHRLLVWVSRDDFLPYFALEKLVFVSGNVTTSITVKSEYYDYGMPFVKELPPEVLSA